MPSSPIPDPSLRAAVVIATYNERENIRRLLPILLGFPDLRVVIVDDASPDGTGMAIRQIAQEHPGRIELIEREGKLGYGSACQAGLQRALELDIDAVVSMDADFSHDPSVVPQLLEGLREHDVVIGSRYVGGVRILNWSLSRLALSVAANSYVRRILRFQVEDCTSGFRAYRRSVLEGLSLRSVDANGYAFLVELLDLVVRAGHRVGEIPIVYEDREHGESKMDRRVMIEAAYKPWTVLGRRLTDRLDDRINRVSSWNSPFSLRGLILATGTFNALLLAFLALVSYGLAGVFPPAHAQPHEAAFLETLGQQLSSLLPSLRPFIASLIGGAALETAWLRVSVYVLPVVGISLASWLLVARVARTGSEVGNEHLRMAVGFAVLYAAIGIVAFPVFTHDLAVAIAWGRMFLDGANPFYDPLLARLFPDLPLDQAETGMTWGPLFGPLLAAVASVARQHPIAEFLVSKLIIATAWLGCLALLLRLLREQSQKRRVIAIVLLGWLPVSIHQVVFEGHYDSLFVFLLLAWLVGLREKQVFLGPLALSASVVLKYATAPLVLVELWWAKREGLFARWSYRLGLLAAGVFGLAIFGLYFRDFAFFDPLRTVQEWSFLSPSAAVVDAVGLLGLHLPRWVAQATVLAVLLPMLAAVVLRVRSQPSTTGLTFLVFVVTGLFLAIAVGHLWPWYLIWLLPLALAVPKPGWAISFALALATLAPLVMAWWIGAASQGQTHRPNLELYLAALLLTPLVLAVLRPSRAHESGTSLPEPLPRSDPGSAAPNVPDVPLASR